LSKPFFGKYQYLICELDPEATTLSCSGLSKQLKPYWSKPVTSYGKYGLRW